MASRVAEYRRRLKKENPEKYREYLEKQRIRSKRNRDEMKLEMSKRKPSPSVIEKKKRQNELSRLRQKRYLDKKKSLEHPEAPLKVKLMYKKPTTRKAEVDMRQRWREAKQKYRQHMTPQKRRWVRAKDRQRKGKNATVAAVNETKTINRKTEWNLTAKARASLPKDPGTFAKVISNLVRNSSPRKRKSVEEHLELKNWKQIRLNLDSSKKGKSPFKTALKIVASKLVKKASARKVAKQLGLCRDTISRLKNQGLKQKPRKLKYNPSDVSNFFKREDVSRVLPQKRYAMKSGPGYVLQVSLKAAYQQYRAEYRQQILTFSKFAALRPKNVRLLNSTHREFCLCVYCVNVRYKLLALGRLSNNEEIKLTNEMELPRIMLCRKSDSERFHKAECINGQCDYCANHERTLRNYFNYAIGVEKITWCHWEKGDASFKGRRILITKTAKGQDIVDELVRDVLNPYQGSSFLQHIFVGRWQSMQYSNAKQNLRDNQILSVMDFAKNRTVTYQDEIKSAFFGARQITIHPIVTHYVFEKKLIRDSHVFISDDITHDFHAVSHFFRLSQEHLKKTLGRSPELNIVFSDGCSSQYKSRGPFADLSLMTTPVSRNFFGSEHGKSEGDGETAVVNRAVDRAVLSRHLIINKAEDMFEWCRDNLTSEDPISKRHFFFVKSGDIDRNRPYTEVKVMPGTRKVHQLKNTGQPYQLEIRDLSCFCSYCLDGQDPPCVNADYVRPFAEKHLARKEANISLENSLDLGFPADMVDSALDVLTGAISEIFVQTPVEDPATVATPMEIPTCINASVPLEATVSVVTPEEGPTALAYPVPVEAVSVPAPEEVDANFTPSSTLPSEKQTLQEKTQAADAQNRSKVKPSDFLWVECTTAKNRKFHYVAQVTTVPTDELSIDPSTDLLYVRFLVQPYKGQPEVWTWKEDANDYEISRSQVQRVLSQPKITLNRTGDVYFKFEDLANNDSA